MRTRVVDHRQRVAWRMVLAVALGAILGPGQSAHGQGARASEVPHYAVTFNADHPREVQVTLNVVVRAPSLEMDTTGLGGPEGSVAAFVRDLRAERATGGALGVRAEGAGRWSLDARPGDAIRVRYTITLAHDSLLPSGALAHGWRVALTEVAFAKPTLAVLTGRTLFVTPAGAQGSAVPGARVDLQLPAGWRGVASWEPAGGRAPTFRAATMGELREGFLAVGPAATLDVTRHAAAGLALDVVTWGPSARAARAEIAHVATTALGMYTGIFGRVPATARGTAYRRVAILVADEDAAARAGGELLRKDVVLLAAAGAPRERMLGMVAHALFHLWSGRAFSHRMPEERWFAEGVTEYYGLHALRRAGVLSDAGYADALDAAFDRYRRDPWIGANSITHAALSGDAHRALVDDGGLLTAACLDPDIRTTTNGAKDLDDVMRALFLRYDTEARRYGNDAVYEAIRTASDDAVARRIARVVEGSAPLALWRCATEPGRPQ